MINYYIYKYFNATDELLYVGITDKVIRRFKEHQKNKDWRLTIQQVELIALEGTRRDCEKVEQSLIEQLKPNHNSATWKFNEKHVPMHRLNFVSFEADNLEEADLKQVNRYKVEELLEETAWERFRRLVPMSNYRIAKYIVILQREGYVFRTDKSGNYDFSASDMYGLEVAEFAEERARKEGIVDRKEIHRCIFETVKKNG